jgi:beta-glucosidase
MTSHLPPLDSLSLPELVAQMVIVRTTGHLFDHEIEYPQWEATQADLQHYLGEVGVGGVILLGGSAAEVALRSQQLQSLAKVPLLIAADIEEGVGQRFSGATWFPPPMALGAIAQHDLPLALTLAEQMGRITAQEALAIGINWILAPTVDVNNNPANPVINVRAFGETPTIVSQLTQAFIRGAHQYPVLTCAKHFPGHGDTAVDSHLALPVVNHGLERLEQVELMPFKAVIASQQVDSIMTAHLLMSTLDQTLPATLSPQVLQGLLRQQLNFDGLIVTDALIMGAITQQYGPYEAAVLAVAAGADVLMMPADPIGAIAAVCEAVKIGRLSLNRIHAAVERIWRAKHKVVGLAVAAECLGHAWETQATLPEVGLIQLAQDSPQQSQAQSSVRQILHASMQVQGTLPLVATRTQGTNLIVVDDILACPFIKRSAPAVALPAQKGYQCQIVDGRQSQGSDLKVSTAPTLVQLFIRGNPFRSSASLLEIAQTWLKAIDQADCLQALVVYGSPYVYAHLKAELRGTIPILFSYGQMSEAQKLAMETLWQGQSAEVDQAFTD